MPRAVNTHLAFDVGYAVAAVILYAFYRKEAPQLGPRRAIALVFLVFLLSSFTNEDHSFVVDRSSDYMPTIQNETLQEEMQEHVVELDPRAVPHSYRFLPNSIVLWIQLAGVRYDAARDIYRMLAGLLIYYAIYRYARLYACPTRTTGDPGLNGPGAPRPVRSPNFLGGILAMLLTAAVYPISFEWYMGQLTDPLSHLSFLLAFIFLETGDFASLLATLIIGSLAKETVLAMSGFYVLFCRKQSNYLLKAIVLCLASLAIYFGVRLFVLHGAMQYQQISGVDTSHVRANWVDIRWHRLFFLTAGAYLPFLALGWKSTPASLKRMVLYLIPVLFVSSLVFSWLREARNWMPAVFVTSVIAGRYLSKLLIDRAALSEF